MNAPVQLATTTRLSALSALRASNEDIRWALRILETGREKFTADVKRKDQVDVLRATINLGACLSSQGVFFAEKPKAALARLVHLTTYSEQNIELLMAIDFENFEYVAGYLFWRSENMPDVEKLDKRALFSTGLEVVMAASEEVNLRLGNSSYELTYDIAGSYGYRTAYQRPTDRLSSGDVLPIAKILELATVCIQVLMSDHLMPIDLAFRLCPRDRRGPDCVD